MSEYGEKHSIAKLIGSPAGYVGYEEGGILTEAIRKNPSSVLCSSISALVPHHGHSSNVIFHSPL